MWTFDSGNIETLPCDLPFCFVQVNMRRPRRVSKLTRKQLNGRRTAQISFLRKRLSIGRWQREADQPSCNVSPSLAGAAGGGHRAGQEAGPATFSARNSFSHRPVVGCCSLSVAKRTSLAFLSRDDRNRSSSRPAAKGRQRTITTERQFTCYEALRDTRARIQKESFRFISSRNRQV